MELDQSLQVTITVLLNPLKAHQTIAMEGFQTDSLGGDAYLTAGLSVFTPVPGFKAYSDSFKLHCFANAGTLMPVYGNVGWKQLPAHLKSLFVATPLSSSVGIGLLWRINVCRLEINATHPLTMSASDKQSPTLQFGLGLEFL